MYFSWKKCGKLGKGAFGTVYLATGIAANSLLAFAAVKTADLKKSDSLMAEAVFLKDFIGDHYVIQAYGVDVSFEENQGMTCNLLMEYAPGGTLHDLIQEYGGLIPEALVAYYSCILLRGISRIHRKGVVHCDIKPANVLVFNNRNHLKLADFGLARYESQKETMRFRGTKLYASPESILHGVHGKGVDIWSFGCTVVEMLTSRRPVRGVQYGPPEIPQYVSELGRDFLMRCFQMSAENRWTADMLLEHPFIKQNTRGVMPPPGFEMANLAKTNNNPFGSNWIRSEGLFASPSSPSTTQHQQQFPRDQNKKNPCLFQNPLKLAEADFINNLFAC